MRRLWMTGGDRQRAASVESAALAGVVAAVLLAVSTYLVEQQPPVGASDAELTAWFSDSGNRTMVIIGANLIPFAAIALLWFIAVVRRRLGDFYVIAGSRFSAVFMVVTSTVGLRFGVLPRWMAALGFLTALVLLVTGAFSGPLAILFPVWLAAVSVTLLLRVGRRPGRPEVPVPPA